MNTLDDVITHAYARLVLRNEELEQQVNLLIDKNAEHEANDEETSVAVALGLKKATEAAVSQRDAVRKRNTELEEKNREMAANLLKCNNSREALATTNHRLSDLVEAQKREIARLRKIVDNSPAEADAHLGMVSAGAVASARDIPLHPWQQAHRAPIALASSAYSIGDFQCGAADWITACWGKNCLFHKRERGLRFAEEAIELMQAIGLSRDDVSAMQDYVYNRKKGDIDNEIGGVLATLAGLATAHMINMEGVARDILLSCWARSLHIRQKHETTPKHLRAWSLDQPATSSDSIGDF